MGRRDISIDCISENDRTDLSGDHDYKKIPQLTTLNTFGFSTGKKMRKKDKRL